MRCHALSSTRKFNHHWQSGDGGGIAPIWYDCAMIGNDRYFWGVRYLPITDQITETIEHSTGEPPYIQGQYNWVIDPTQWDGTNAYTDILVHNGIDYNVNVDYYKLDSVQFIPHFGGVPYWDDPESLFDLTYHEDDQQAHIYQFNIKSNVKLLKYIADVYFVKITSSNLPSYVGVGYTENESFLNRYKNNIIIKPVGFAPVWQGSLTPLHIQPYGLRSVNSLSSQFVTQRRRIPSSEWQADYYGVANYHTRATFSEGWENEFPDFQNYLFAPICNAHAPATCDFVSGSGNLAWLGRYGVAVPFCNYTSYDILGSPEWAESTWNRDLQVQFSPVDNYSRYNAEQWGIIIALKEIQGFEGKIYG